MVWERTQCAHATYGIAFCWEAYSATMPIIYRVYRRRDNRYELWVFCRWNTWNQMVAPDPDGMPFRVGGKKRFDSAPKAKGVAERAERWMRSEMKEIWSNRSGGKLSV